jgi:hypothetical protein
MKKTLLAGVAAAVTMIAAPASAALFNVDALANSSSGGTGLATINLFAGQAFSVSVNPNDLWNAGALPRWSNADGLTGNRFATGSDDSGQAVGTLIGINFGSYSQGNLTAPYGTLVGQIGNGNFFVVGSAYASVAAASGTLKLYYWDSNNGDNSQFITANVTSAVPEPSTWAMMVLGFAGLAWTTRRRRQTLPQTL